MFLPPANNQVDSVTANLPQQETDSVDNKQKQWTSSYPSFTYPLKSIKVTSPYGYRRDPFTGKLSWHNGLDLRAKNEPAYAMMDGIVEKVGYDNRSGNYVTVKVKVYFPVSLLVLLAIPVAVLAAISTLHAKRMARVSIPPSFSQLTVLRYNENRPT